MATWDNRKIFVNYDYTEGDEMSVLWTVIAKGKTIIVDKDSKIVSNEAQETWINPIIEGLKAYC